MTDTPPVVAPPAAPPATPPAAPPAPSAYDWKGALGESHATYEPLIAGKGWKSPAEALAGYSNLEKMIGGDKIALPGKDAKPEEWNAIFAKLGRPEKPDGYEFKKPEGWDGYSDEFAGKARDAFHKAGLSAKQAAALHDWWAGEAKAMQDGAGAAGTAQAEAAALALATEIKTGWGTEKDAKLDQAKRAARHFGLDQATLDALESKAGSFKMLDGLARIGASLREDPLAGGKSGPIQSAEEARGELTRLEADKDFRAAYLDRGHAGHAEAVRRMTALAERASPGNVGQGYR